MDKRSPSDSMRVYDDSVVLRRSDWRRPARHGSRSLVCQAFDDGGRGHGRNTLGQSSDEASRANSAAGGDEAVRKERSNRGNAQGDG